MSETSAPSTTPSAPQETPIVAPTIAPVFVEPHSHASITDAEGAQIVRDIREALVKGTISPAWADARFAEMHTPLDQRVVTPDLRSDGGLGR